MTTTILLVRHAAHGHIGRILSGRMPDIPLSPEGRSQAARLGERLAAMGGYCHVHSSPVQRARETAQAIARACGSSPPIVADALDEIDFGDWTGRAFDTLDGDPAWAAWNEKRSRARPPGGEAIAQVQARLMAHVAGAAAAYPGGTVVMVSHCDVIRAGIAGWLGLSLDHLLRFDIDTATISRIAAAPWGTRVLTLNEGLE